MDVPYMLGLFDGPAKKGAFDAILKGNAIPGLTGRIHDLPGEVRTRPIAAFRF